MEQLRVDTAALYAMAAGWVNSAGELTETTVPTWPGSSSQPSAAAVLTAQADVAGFTADLTTQVEMRARHVTDANAHYIAHESHSASELAAVTGSPTVV